MIELALFWRLRLLDSLAACRRSWAGFPASQDSLPAAGAHRRDSSSGTKSRTGVFERDSGGQTIWHAVPVDEPCAKHKSMAQTRLQPVVLDIASDSDIEDWKTPVHHRELRLKKIERRTQQAYDQGALLPQLDLAVLPTTSKQTAGDYVREYHNLYSRPLPTRGNVQLIGSGQTHKREIITLHLKGYLVPVICKRTNHFKESVERYIHDYEAIKLLASKFDDVDLISRIVRLKASVVKQYLDLIPLDPQTSQT